MTTASKRAGRCGAGGAVLLLLLLVLAGGVPPAGAQPPSLGQQVRQLSAEVQLLREQVDGLGRQLEMGAEQAARAAETHNEADRSFREWFADATRRTERLEQSSAEADRQLATAAAAVEAGLKASIDRVAERLARLEQDIAGLAEVRQTVARLDEGDAERVRQQATDTAQLRALVEETRGRLAQRMDRLEQEAGAQAEAQDAAVAELRAGMDQATGQLAERLDRVEKEQASAAQLRAGTGEARLERLLGASVHLSAVTRTARPFGRELAYVRQIGEGVRGIEAPINELLVHASRGAPTVADLRHSFEALAPMVVARAATNEEGWTGTARRWATEAGARFGVVEPPPPTAAHAAVQTAELHLARGQLPQAIAALAPLDAAALSQAATWIIHARSRIAIDQAATELVNRVMAQVLTR